MASMAYSICYNYNPKNTIQQNTQQILNFAQHFCILSCQKQQQKNEPINRREFILRSSELATLGALFHFSSSDLDHYAPPWNYNLEGGRGSKKPVSREEAMKELLEVIESTKPDNFTPKIMEKRADYVCVEFESPIVGFVDDVEFWFPPGDKSIVEYRSASRLGSFDFDVNQKRIKALRQKLEKKGWASENTY